MMRNIYKSVMKVVGVLLATLVLSACSDSDSDGTSQMNGGSTYLQVTVQVASDSDTRADDGPNGGEDGDGREAGINHENEVNDVTLLLYQATDGINASDATITHIVYFSSVYVGNNDNYITTTEKVEDLDVSATYHAIVVANAGDLTTALTGKSLSEVRDYLLTSAWTEATTIANYNNFAMSSEDDATLDFSEGTGKETNPYTMTATIERVAARIDFDVTDVDEYTSSGSFAGYVYPVYKDATDTSVKGYLVLTHVMPFNELNSGSYLIKRVYDSTNGTTYLGDETMDGSYRATNYVVDPYWSDKSLASYTRGYTTADAAKAATSSEYSSWGVQQSKYTSDSGEDYYILDYTLENTTSDNSTTYATGLYFRGTYYEAADWDADTNQPETDATGEDRTYVYYLRHSDPLDEKNASNPMLYGVVRNNIYRVSVSRVVEKDGMILTINVRKWAYYEHSEIVM